MKKYFSILILTLFISTIGFSQQSLMLNSGKRIYITDIKPDTSGIIFYKNLKGKVKWIEMEDVFSWTREDSVEVIFYKPACEDVCFRIDQMRDYLHGKADGLERKTRGATVAGFVVGATSGVLLPAAGLTIISPLFPASNSIIIGLFNPKPEKNGIKEQYADNNHYKEGYTSSIKKKRIVNSIISGGAGLISGIIVVQILTK